MHTLGPPDIDLIPQSSIIAFNGHPFKHLPNIPPPFPTLPSSPAAFDLDASPSPLGLYDRPPTLIPHRADYHPDPACPRDLDRLRLAALTELQKSVVEKGEGFVDKMRYWESHRQPQPTRGLKRSRSMMAGGTLDSVDDSDDVMIMDSTSGEEVQLWKSRKKTTLSIGGVDGMDVAPLEETPSTTDDDTESSSRDSMSLIPPEAPPPPDVPSYSDKAVSALTLAFANGACGINDYQAVLDAYNNTHYGEESHVGELWG